MLVFHPFKTLLWFLIYSVRLLAGSVEAGWDVHDWWTVGKKLSCCSQQFSNLKILGFGINVTTSMTQGQWSDTSMMRDHPIVFRYLRVQLAEEKNQSSLSRRGSGRLLVQVNLLPWSGISTKPSLLMASLKRYISWTSPPSLFLSLGLWMRLKSPTINQVISSGICIAWNHSKKLSLPLICARSINCC